MLTTSAVALSTALIQRVGAMQGTVMFLVGYLASHYKHTYKRISHRVLLTLYRIGLLNTDWLGEDLAYPVDAMARFERLNENLPADVRNAIPGLIKSYMRFLSQSKSSEELMRARNAINILLEISEGRYHEAITPAQVSAMETLVQEDYPDVADQLMYYVYHIARFIADPHHTHNPGPLLLRGDPGTLKKEFIDAIAKEFDLYVRRIGSLANLGPSDLWGRDSVDITQKYDKGILWRVLEKAVRNGRRPPYIILFDDIMESFTLEGKVEESQVIEWLCLILNSKTITLDIHLYDAHVGASRPISGIKLNLQRDFIFVLTTSALDLLEYSKTLGDRLQYCVEMQPLRKNKKKEIAVVHAKAFLKDNTSLAVTDGVISETVDQMMRYDIDSGYKTILDAVDKWLSALTYGASFSVETYYGAVRRNQEQSEADVLSIPGPVLALYNSYGLSPTGNHNHEALVTAMVANNGFTSDEARSYLRHFKC